MNYMTNCARCGEFKEVKAKIEITEKQRDGTNYRIGPVEVCEDCCESVKKQLGEQK